MKVWLKPSEKASCMPLARAMRVAPRTYLFSDVPNEAQPLRLVKYFVVMISGHSGE